MKKQNKGFTLAEMLIVVAIIALLTTIATPMALSKLENAREKVDKMNIKNAMSELTQASLSGEYSAGSGITYDKQKDSYTKKVYATQKKLNWQGDDNNEEVTVNGATIHSAIGSELVSYWEITLETEGPVFKIEAK